MTVTGEYRTGMIRATFAATPNRPLVLAAKAVVAASFSAVFTAALCRGRGRGGAAGGRPRLSARGCRSPVRRCGGWPRRWRCSPRVAAVLGVAVGALLRHAAGAVAVLLMWPLVVEPIVGNLPSIGARVGPYLPFGNAFLFVDVQWLFPTYVMPWGPSGRWSTSPSSSVSIFAAATVVVVKRDA